MLITFPTELVSAVVAGRWATSPHPFTPWLIGYRMRLALAALRWVYCGGLSRARAVQVWWWAMQRTVYKWSRTRICRKMGACMCTWCRQ